MDELRRWYRDGLAARAEQLERELEDLHDGDPEAAGRLRALALTLRSTGASYGFAAISEAARPIEDAAATALAGEVHALVAALRAVVAEGDPRRRGILVVDDDPALAPWLGERLRALGRPVLPVLSARGVADALRDRDVAAIVLDLVLPDEDGRRVLARLREDPSVAGVPILVVTSRAGDAVLAECRALGAAGVFEKPAGNEALARALETELARAEAGASDPRVDALTGLGSRAALREAFETWTATSGGAPPPLALALLELDEVGGGVPRERAFAQAAAALARALPPGDVAARWEGEHVAAVLQGVRREQAEARLARALRVASGAPGTGGVRGGAAAGALPTWSGGLVEVTPGATLDECLGEAARLLAAAQAAGGARVMSREWREGLARRTALFAEDDEVMQVFVRHLLAREGFDVLHFGDGQSALDAAPGSGARLVVLDVQMPRLDGFSVLERLRALPAFARVPIVMLTSLGSDRDVSRGFDLGADDYIVKPFSPEQMLARIRRLMRRAEAAPAS